MKTEITFKRVGDSLEITTSFTVPVSGWYNMSGGIYYIAAGEAVKTKHDIKVEDFINKIEELIK